jgi:hypothetical protein
VAAQSAGVIARARFFWGRSPPAKATREINDTIAKLLRVHPGAVRILCQIFDYGIGASWICCHSTGKTPALNRKMVALIVNGLGILD